MMEPMDGDALLFGTPRTVVASRQPSNPWKYMCYCMWLLNVSIVGFMLFSVGVYIGTNAVKHNMETSTVKVGGHKGATCAFLMTTTTTTTATTTTTTKTCYCRYDRAMSGECLSECFTMSVGNADMKVWAYLKTTTTTTPIRGSYHVVPVNGQYKLIFVTMTTTTVDK